jgi:hypothetical protein
MKLSLSLVFLPLAVLHAEQSSNPLLILAKDLGYVDLGVHGLRADFKTPHLDIVEGMKTKLTGCMAKFDPAGIPPEPLNKKESKRYRQQFGASGPSAP